MRIRQKLSIVTILMVVLPLLFISGLFLFKATRMMESEIAKKLLAARNFKADQIESFFIDRDINLLSLQHSLTVKTYLPRIIAHRSDRSCKAYKRAKAGLDDRMNIYDTTRRFNCILCTDTAGFVVYVSNSALATYYLDKRLPCVGPELLRSALRGNCYSDLFTDAVLPNRHDGMYQLGALHDDQGRLLGLIAMEINIDNIYGIMGDKSGLGKTGETVLAKRENDSMVMFISPLMIKSVTSDSPSAEIMPLPAKWEVKLGSSAGLPQQLAVTGKDGVGITTDYRGREVLAAWKPVHRFNWGLVAKVDIDEIHEPIRRFQNIMLLVLFVTAGFVVAAALVMAKAIADPVRSLQKGAEIIGGGNLDHKMALQSNDEIGQLSRAFDDMVARIKRVTASRDLLDKVTKELERSNAELEQFAYVASHDLKSPLRAIESLASWIREDLEPALGDATRKHLDLLDNRVLRMEKLLDDLLDYSRIGRAGFDVKETDTAGLVRQITGLLHVPESFKVETRGRLPVFHTAVTPFGTVVRNLINNAIKHHDMEGGLILFTAEDRGPLYEFCVSDDGPGIPEEFRERVFGMFQTLKSRDEVEGSGIGLTIVKKTVEYFGGTVTLGDNLPRGLRVRFTWPKIIAERKENT